MARNFDFSDFLILTATVQQYTLAVDDMGGEVETYSTKTSVGDNGTFACSLQPIGGAKQEFFARMNMTVNHVAYTDEVLDISNGDRIVVDSVNYRVNYKEVQGGTAEVMAIYLDRIE